MDNSFRNNQLIIFQSLVEGTMRECAKLEERERRHLSIGAFDTVLALRNFGQGIPMARFVRQLFPVDNAVKFDYDCISEFYPIEDLLRQDVFELATFQKHEGTRFCFKSGKRETGLSWRPVVRFNGEQLNY